VQHLQHAIDAAARALQPVLLQYAQPVTQSSGNGATTAMEALDALQRTADLRALHQLLDASNMEALEVFARMQQTYGSAWESAFAPMAQAIAQLDFSGATSHCQSLLDHSPDNTLTKSS
jgi:hypothetical protein